MSNIAINQNTKKNPLPKELLNPAKISDTTRNYKSKLVNVNIPNSREKEKKRSIDIKVIQTKNYIHTKNLSQHSLLSKNIFYSR